MPEIVAALDVDRHPILGLEGRFALPVPEAVERLEIEAPSVDEFRVGAAEAPLRERPKLLDPQVQERAPISHQRLHLRLLEKA